MKKNNSKKWLIGLFAAVFAFSMPMSVYAESANIDSAQVEVSVGEGVDFFGSSSGSVDSIAETVAESLRKNSNESQVEALVKGLDSIGVESGWAKQIGKLDKISGVAGALSKAVSLLDKSLAFGNLVAAAQNRDRAAFQRIIADELTSAAADVIAGQISGILYKQAIGSAAAGLVSGGSSLVWAGITLIGGIVVDQMGSDLIQGAIRDSFIDGMLLDLGGAIYDSMFGSEETPSDDGSGGMCPVPKEPDPFDGQPESGNDGSGGKKERFQGLKPIKLF